MIGTKILHEKEKKDTRSEYGTCYVSRLALKKFVKSQMVFCVIVCTIWPWENGKDWSVPATIYDPLAVQIDWLTRFYYR